MSRVQLLQHKLGQVRPLAIDNTSTEAIRVAFAMLICGDPG